LSDATRSKIEAKVEKLTRLFDRLSDISVTIDLEHRTEPTVDVKVSAEHKHDFVATVKSDDLMSSVDQVIHKLEQQIRKYKQKIQGRHRGQGSRPQATASESEPSNP
jgi:putative sigma-54 modulation protein